MRHFDLERILVVAEEGTYLGLTATACASSAESVRERNAARQLRPTLTDEERAQVAVEVIQTLRECGPLRMAALVRATELPEWQIYDWLISLPANDLSILCTDESYYCLPEHPGTGKYVDRVRKRKPIDRSASTAAH